MNKITICLTDNHFNGSDNYSRAWRYSVVDDKQDEFNSDLGYTKDQTASLTKHQVELLRALSNEKIGVHKLIYPQSYKVYGNKIEEKYVFKLHTNENGGYIETSNVMGYLSISDGEDEIAIRIRSRFDTDYPKEGNHTNDFFLHYMLQTALGYNILSDFDYTYNDGSIFDMLMYIFPSIMNKAIKQGLFRKYVKREFNDSNIKGAIDTPRHIRENLPFLGKVAYNARVYTTDNSLIHLIRHAIEAIRRKPGGRTILTRDKTTREAVDIIESLTQNYSPKNQNRVLQDNRVKASHPYYTDYVPLQQICIQILLHKKLQYAPNNANNKKIYGILFDGSWLWEAYIAKILEKGERESILNTHFIHSDNNLKTNGIFFFEKNRGPRYPDFYSSEKKLGEETHNYVLDAKYKHFLPEEAVSGAGDDVLQLVAYMYVLKAKLSALVFPFHEDDKDFTGKEVSDKLNLNGYGGHMTMFGLKIPQEEGKCFSEFSETMRERENEFLEKIKNAVNSQQLS